LSVGEQLTNNKAHIEKKYKAHKFIAYFQNYTNTYMDIEIFKIYIRDALIEDIIGLSISTRPDSIFIEHLEVLKAIKVAHEIDIEIELGLQTTNEKTLRWLNRGHGVQSFIDAVERIHQYGFSVCAHLIPNLPGDTLQDTIDAVNLLNSLNVEQVKLHSLYITKDTELGNMYLNDEFEIDSKEVYFERVITFIELANKNMVFQRLFARAPKELTLFCNWQTSWRKLHDELINRMQEQHTFQGKYYIPTNNGDITGA
jgi:radical SAM protein (TIGR01212 family)